MWRLYYLKRIMTEERGIGVVEVILILVVLIGLVLIFKSRALQVWFRIYFKRSQVKAPAYEAMKKGEVTAYLSLVFILLMTFVGGIMESASIQMAKNYRRADMNRAMESVFAEYQKELLEEYENIRTGYRI